MGEMTAGHFIYVPVTMLIGVVVGWVLGSRAAQDAFASEMKRREAKAARTASKQAQ
ncbi:MAG: hypothetical protein Q8L86_02510 [Vicinamibacterales bacterium]|nr:hypothetical protein [Vicinamibacterales bacterium]